MGAWRAWGAVLAGIATVGAAGSQPLPSPESDAWEPLVFRSIEKPTHYTPLAGEAGVRAEARCGASARVLPLQTVDLARTPVLEWRWRLERRLDVPDERTRKGDDFAARVYVMFRFEPEKASLFERARHRLGERLFGTEMPGHALNFVWSSRVPTGTAWTSPHTESARLIAVASGPPDGWRRERVDVVAVHRTSFGEAPPDAVGLGIMTDADDTCGHAIASFADFRFVERADPMQPDGSDGILDPTSTRLPE